jgi:hypothetical protein
MELTGHRVIIYFTLCVVLGMDSWASCMLGNHSSTKLHSKSCASLFEEALLGFGMDSCDKLTSLSKTSTSLILIVYYHEVHTPQIEI